MAITDNKCENEAGYIYDLFRYSNGSEYEWTKKEALKTIEIVRELIEKQWDEDGEEK